MISLHVFPGQTREGAKKPESGGRRGLFKLAKKQENIVKGLGLTLTAGVEFGPADKPGFGQALTVYG